MFEKSPAKFEKSPAKFENAPAKFEFAPAKFENAPAKFENAPAKFENAPAKFKNACMLPFEVQVSSRDVNVPFMLQASMIERQRIWERVHVDDHPCGACAMYEFQKLGIGSMKVVGRGNPLERKVLDIQFLKRLLDMLDGNISRSEFYQISRKLYQQTYSRQCRSHMCYYPEVMLDGAGGT